MCLADQMNSPPLGHSETEVDRGSEMLNRWLLRLVVLVVSTPARGRGMEGCL